MTEPRDFNKERDSLYAVLCGALLPARPAVQVRRDPSSPDEYLFQILGADGSVLYRGGDLNLAARAAVFAVCPAELVPTGEVTGDGLARAVAAKPGHTLCVGALPLLAYSAELHERLAAVALGHRAEPQFGSTGVYLCRNVLQPLTAVVLLYIRERVYSDALADAYRQMDELARR